MCTLAAANSSADLLLQLKSNPPSVAVRGQGRTKEQTQARSTYSLLSALACTGYLTFPLEGRCGDRPDFELHFGETSIGVEITEVTDENFARAQVIRDREFPNALIDGSIFRWANRPIKSRRLRKFLSQVGDRLTGPGFVGDHPEYEWAQATLDTIASKTASINACEYRPLPQYWLAIHENLLHLPGVNLPRAVGYLGSKLLDLPAATRMFKYLFIEVEGQHIMVAMNPHGQAAYLSIR